MRHDPRATSDGWWRDDLPWPPSGNQHGARHPTRAATGDRPYTVANREGQSIRSSNEGCPSHVGIA